MQAFCVFHRVLLAALAVSAAKLPLPAPLGSPENLAPNFVPVPSQLSALYQTPVASPAPAQPTNVVQTSAVLPPVPAELPTLYEAPSEDVPSVAQPSTLSQIPVEILPVQHSSTFQAPVPVPVEPSSFHEGPFDNVPAQLSAINIVPVPDEPSLLYDVPVEPQSASAQQSNVPQTPVQNIPANLHDLPFENVLAASQQPSLVETPINVIPVPSESATFFEVSSDNLPSPVQQPGLVQSPFNPVPVPDEPASLYELPLANLPVPAQQPSLVQPINGVPVPSESVLVSNVPSANIPFPTQPSNVGQSSAVIVPVPAEPSTLYDVPVEVVASPSQTPIIQAPIIEVIQEQASPVGHFHTTGNVPAVSVVVDPSVLYDTPAVPIPVPNGDEEVLLVGSQVQIPQVVVVPVPQEPSDLYETPNGFPPVIVSPSFVPEIQEQSVPSASFNTPTELFQDTREPSPGTFSHLLVDEPAALYETPSEGLPVASTIGSVHSVPQQVVNTPTEFQTIQFPEQSPIQRPAPFEIVQVPSLPSNLYEFPNLGGSFQAGHPSGKSMTSNNEIQREFESASSSVHEVPAAASSPVASVAKGNAMAGMPYKFQWGVDDNDSGNTFTHYENSDGQSTSGQYRVNLPDGRIQVVNFYDNGDGFHADVTYE